MAKKDIEAQRFRPIDHNRGKATIIVKYTLSQRPNKPLTMLRRHFRCAASARKMVSFLPWVPRRLFSAEVSKTHQHHRNWTIKQVTKSNFSETLDGIKSHISTSDFIAVSLQKTGSFSAPWHRVSPFDTLDTAYLKAKHAAERFQVLQFAVCPFTITGSEVTAYPSVPLSILFLLSPVCFFSEKMKENLVILKRWSDYIQVVFFFLGAGITFICSPGMN